MNVPLMKIKAIAVTHHRLPLDPPSNASWDTRPRTRFDPVGWIHMPETPGMGYALD